MPLFGSVEKPAGNTQEKKKLPSLAEMQQKALADIAAEKENKTPDAANGATPLDERKLDTTHTGGLLTTLREQIKKAERDARPEWRKRAEDGEGLPMKDLTNDKSVESRRG